MFFFYFFLQTTHQANRLDLPMWYLQSEGVCSDANFLTGLRRDLQASHSFRVSGKNTILPAPFRTALCDKISNDS